MNDLFIVYGAIVLALWIVPIFMLMAGKRK